MSSTLKSKNKEWLIMKFRKVPHVFQIAVCTLCLDLSIIVNIQPKKLKKHLPKMFLDTFYLSSNILSMPSVVSLIVHDSMFCYFFFPKLEYILIIFLTLCNYYAVKFILL